MEASNECEVLHVPEERVRYVLQARSFESYKDGRSHCQDAGRWLGNSHANLAHWRSPNSPPLRQARHDYGFVQKELMSAIEHTSNGHGYTSSRGPRKPRRSKSDRKNGGESDASRGSGEVAEPEATVSGSGSPRSSLRTTSARMHQNVCLLVFAFLPLPFPRSYVVLTRLPSTSTCEPFLIAVKTYSASRGRNMHTRCHSVLDVHSSSAFFQARCVATERTVNFE